MQSKSTIADGEAAVIGFENRSPEPKYKGLATAIESMLGAKQYPDGFQLPTERNLAHQFDVSVMTLRRALEILEDRGAISREQGRGTFVRRGAHPLAAANAGARAQSVAFVRIDNPSGHDPYADTAPEAYRPLLSAIDGKLQEHQRHLVVAHTGTRDLAAGRLPQAIEQGAVAGLIMDGYVDDYHVECMKALGLPLVVVGNHDLHVPATTVRFDFAEMAYQVSMALIKRQCGPVFLGIEPFVMAYTRELFAGYLKACREAGQVEQVYLLGTGTEDRVMVERMVNDAAGPFGLLLAYNAAHAVVDVFRERNLSMTDHPICVYGAADAVSPEMKRALNVHPGYTGISPLAAVELIEKLIAGEPAESVSIAPIVTCRDEDGEWRLDLKWDRGK